MLYAKALDTVLQSRGNKQDAVQIEAAMRQLEFEGISGWVSLGGLLMSQMTSCGITRHKSVDDNGDRILDVGFVNVVAGDQWPKVAHYDGRAQVMTLLGDITWPSGTNRKVRHPALCACPTMNAMHAIANWYDS